MGPRECADQGMKRDRSVLACAFGGDIFTNLKEVEADD